MKRNMLLIIYITRLAARRLRRHAGPPSYCLRWTFLHILAFVSVDHFMWASYCNNGFVKVISTKWQFIYMVDNLSISILKVLRFFAALFTTPYYLVVSLLFLMYTLSLTLSHLGVLRRLLPEGSGFHSPLLLR